MDRLQRGQVAVVTGGASGIGLALAEAFAGLGLSVVLSDIEEARLHAAAEKVGQHGASVLPVRTDVSKSAEVDDLCRKTLERFGRVDVLCNNAGVIPGFAPTWEYDLKDWQWMIGVNLWGVIHGIRTFVPHLVAQGSGHIVNTASMAGICVMPYHSAYSASKHAVVSISESLREELDQRAPDVGVTILCPGGVRTRIGSSARNRPADLSVPSAKSMPFPLEKEPWSVLIDPADVAGKVVAAIQANQLYLTTHTGSSGSVRRRMERLMMDIKDE